MFNGTYDISQTAFIRSRHGRVTEASLTSTVSEAQEVMVIAALEEALLGNIDVLIQLVKRYTVIK